MLPRNPIQTRRVGRQPLRDRPGRRSPCRRSRARPTSRSSSRTPTSGPTSVVYRRQPSWAYSEMPPLGGRTSSPARSRSRPGATRCRRGAPQDHRPDRPRTARACSRGSPSRKPGLHSAMTNPSHQRSVLRVGLPRRLLLPLSSLPWAWRTGRGTVCAYCDLARVGAVIPVCLKPVNGPPSAGAFRAGAA